MPPKKAKKKPTRKKSPEYSDSGSDYSDSSGYGSSDYESSDSSSSDYSSSSRSPSPVRKKKTGKKRALSDYQKFCKKERPKVKRDHPNMKPQSVMKELGKRWRRHNR